VRKRAIGYAILLTNDSAYWTLPRRRTVDADFRINEGRTLSGELKWGKAASEGTMRGRENPIILTGSYTLNWQDYSEIGEINYGRFRYLLVEIKADILN